MYDTGSGEVVDPELINKYDEYITNYRTLGELKYQRPFNNFDKYPIRKIINNAVLWALPASTLISDLQKAMNDKHNTDFSITINGIIYNLHSIFLHFRIGANFKKLLEHKFTQTEHYCTNEAFLAFIQFVYTDTLPKNLKNNQIDQLIELAEYFNINELFIICKNYDKIEDFGIPLSNEKTLSLDLQKMVNCPLFSDVKLIAQRDSENRFIYAHKVILSNRSPYYQALFLRWSHGDSNEVVVDLSYEACLAFMNYLYSDFHEIEPQTAAELVIEGPFIDSRLAKVCQKHIELGLDADNVLIFWRMDIDPKSNLRNYV